MTAAVFAQLYYGPVTIWDWWAASKDSNRRTKSFLHIADPEQAVRAGTLICEEDSGSAVVLGGKLERFPIVTATWDRRLHAAAAAAMAADRAAELSAAVSGLSWLPHVSYQALTSPSRQRGCSAGRVAFVQCV